MSKVLVFSRVFPSYHPLKGAQTYFVEKLYSSFLLPNIPGIKKNIPLSSKMSLSDDYFEPKHHTIRAGNRWKAGDKFSPRVWSGKPYSSKQITIYDDVEIKKVFDFKIEAGGHNVLVRINGRAFYEENERFTTETEALRILAQNDGLSIGEIKKWFKWPKPFDGQIICWNDKIEY